MQRDKLKKYQKKVRCLLYGIKLPNVYTLVHTCNTHIVHTQLMHTHIHKCTHTYTHTRIIHIMHTHIHVQVGLQMGREKEVARQLLKDGKRE